VHPNSINYGTHSLRCHLFDEKLNAEKMGEGKNNG